MTATTVAELIAELGEYPPETKVLGWDGADYCPESGPAYIAEHWVHRPHDASYIDETTIEIKG